MTVRLRVQGANALFPRPEFTQDRISYDVPPPLALRNILDRLHASPAIRWQIWRIHVLSPIATSLTHWVRGGQDVRVILLENVDYVVEADIILTARAGARDTIEQHLAVFAANASQLPAGPPFLGHPEFPATLSLLAPEDAVPTNAHGGVEIDLGWMPLETLGKRGGQSSLFRAKLVNGVIDVPSPGDASLFH